MQRSAAIASALSTMSRAPSCVFCSNASAALCAYGPPEPMATMPSSGSSTSTAPALMSDTPRAAGDDAEAWLEPIRRAGDDERMLAVGHGEHRLQPAQDAVGAPVLGEL